MLVVGWSSAAVRELRLPGRRDEGEVVGNAAQSVDRRLPLGVGSAKVLDVSDQNVMNY